MRWRWFPGRLFFALILMGNGVSPAGAQECPSPDFGYKALYTAIYNLADMTGYNETAGDDEIPEPSPSTPFFKKSVAAYIWGLPLVEMRRTQWDITDRYDLEPNDLFTADKRNMDTAVVAPNLDVLNATGFIDFSTVDAFVLTVPDTVGPPTRKTARAPSTSCNWSMPTPT